MSSELDITSWISEHLPGTLDGEFKNQADRRDSPLGHILDMTLCSDRQLPPLAPRQLASLAMLTTKTRALSEEQILDTVAKFPAFERRLSARGIPRPLVIPTTGSRSYCSTVSVLVAVQAYLDIQASTFEVDLVPLKYVAPRDAEQRAIWNRQMKISEVEDEEGGYFRFHREEDPEAYDWTHDWVDEELHSSREPKEYRFYLPPARESVVFAAFLPYDLAAPTTSQPRDTENHWDDLPNELKIRIMNLVLKFPGSLQVESRAYPDYDNEEDVVFRFHVELKVPKALVPTRDDGRGGRSHIRGYWKLEGPATLLEICLVNTEFFHLGRSAFYGSNTFEAYMGSGVFCKGPCKYGSSVPRWLRLLSCDKAADGTPRFGPIRAIDFVTKLNLERYQWDESQTDYLFNRAIDVVMRMQNLQRLVICIDMIYIKCMKTSDLSDPTKCSGVRRLAWAKSALRGDGKLAVYMPRSQATQRWLKDQIEMGPDNLNKLPLERFEWYDGKHSTLWHEGKDSTLYPEDLPFLTGLTVRQKEALAGRVSKWCQEIESGTDEQTILNTQQRLRNLAAQAHVHRLRVHDCGQLHADVNTWAVELKKELKENYLEAQKEKLAGNPDTQRVVGSIIHSNIDNTQRANGFLNGLSNLHTFQRFNYISKTVYLFTMMKDFDNAGNPGGSSIQYTEAASEAHRVLVDAIAENDWAASLV